MKSFSILFVDSLHVQIDSKKSQIQIINAQFIFLWRYFEESKNSVSIAGDLMSIKRETGATQANDFLVA